MNNWKHWLKAVNVFHCQRYNCRNPGYPLLSCLPPRIGALPLLHWIHQTSNSDSIKAFWVPDYIIGLVQCSSSCLQYPSFFSLLIFIFSVLWSSLGSPSHLQYSAHSLDYGFSSLSHQYSVLMSLVKKGDTFPPSLLTCPFSGSGWIGLLGYLTKVSPLPCSFDFFTPDVLQEAQASHRGLQLLRTLCDTDSANLSDPGPSQHVIIDTKLTTHLSITSLCCP